MNKRGWFGAGLLCVGSGLGFIVHDAWRMPQSLAQQPQSSVPAKSQLTPLSPPPQLEVPPRLDAFSTTSAPAAQPTPLALPVAKPQVAAQPSRPLNSIPNSVQNNIPTAVVPASAVADSQQLAFAADDGLLPEERTNIAVYERCNRSVVHIATKSAKMESFLTVSLRKGTGSGSVLDQAGTILTNQHVIEGAKEITVSLYNGVSYPAALVGQDPDTDIAILRIEAPAEQLEPMAFGDSLNLRVGQRIYAIGNPFGLERTMSAGMISSLNRVIPSSERRTMRSLIQVDMSLNQGNSGGPLLNTRGELIGMNAAIMSSDGDSAGVGFAIPASTIQRIVGKLLTEGRVIRPTIGITRVYENENGLLIVTVARGGPAETAGLKGFSLVSKPMRQGLYRFEQQSIDPSTADLIQSIDGLPVKSADQLLEIIENKSPGDTVVLEIVRSGQKARVQVKLGKSE